MNFMAVGHVCFVISGYGLIDDGDMCAPKLIVIVQS